MIIKIYSLKLMSNNRAIINLIKLQPFRPYSKIRINLNNKIQFKKPNKLILFNIKIKIL